MAKITIGITTAPRPDARRYVERTINSTRAAGFDGPINVFAEPNSLEVQQPGVTYYWNKTALGCFPNFKNAVHKSYQKTNSGWLLILQDDLLWTPDAAEKLSSYLDALQHPNRHGFISPYTSPAMVKSRKNPGAGWVDVSFHNKSFWGALALCFPRSSAQRLLADKRFQAHTHHRKVDVVVGNVFKRLGLRMKVHVPSLATHIGARSTIGRDKIKGNNWGRKGFRFPGSTEDS